MVGEQVQIVGHPEGRPKALSSGKEVKYVLDDFLQYVSGIGTGGSGAPVFNMQWELVAMHHAAFMEPSPSDVEGGSFLGEATLVSAIVQSLEEADTYGTDGHLIADIFEGGAG